LNFLFFNSAPCQTLSSDRPDEEVTVMQLVEVTEKYVDATLEECDDGLDNDIDGKADATDEECNASTTYSSPVRGQRKLRS
jgi:hypothetical protein